MNRRDNVGKGRGEVLAATRDTLDIQATRSASLISFGPDISDIEVLSRTLAEYTPSLAIIAFNHQK